jgi:hypothetical protein
VRVEADLAGHRQVALQQLGDVLDGEPAHLKVEVGAAFRRQQAVRVDAPGTVGELEVHDLDAASAPSHLR